LIAVPVAVARTVKRELDPANDPADMKTASATADRPTGSKVAACALNRLLPWLASALLITMGAVAALLWTASAATAGFTLSQLWPVTIALAIMLLSRVAMDVNNSSLHSLYRWRIAATYAVTRRAASERKPQTREKRFAEAASTRLSRLGTQVSGPTLVIGATANVDANRAVAPGRGGCPRKSIPRKLGIGLPSCQTAARQQANNSTHASAGPQQALTPSGQRVTPAIKIFSWIEVG
jgi:hypothetical protein